MKKNRENILITRTLSKESSIWSLCEDGHKVIAQSFLEIVPFRITHIPQAEVYFYYSKNAAIQFQLASARLSIDLSSASHASMGNGTADSLKNFNIDSDFIGKGCPQNVAAQLIDKYCPHSICFVRAEQSTQSIQKLWPGKYSEVIAYSVKPISIQIKEKFHTIFATSPMNLEAALQCCDTTKLKRIVCIGPTTYNTASQLSKADIIVAIESSEYGLLEAYLDDQK